MKHLKQKTLAVTTASMLGLGSAGIAHADAKAFSSLDIHDFIITDSGGDQFGLNDFESLVASDTADNSATLTGFPGEANSVTVEISETDPVLGVADPGLSCVGPDCSGIAQNDYDQQPIPPLQLFSRADSLTEGAIISGVVDEDGNPVGPAHAAQVAEVQINTPDYSGSSDASVSNSSQFNFSLSEATDMRFAFDATANLHLQTFDSTARAKADRHFLITIARGNDLQFRWAPDGVNNPITGGTEVQDPFSLNEARSLLSEGEVAFNDDGTFEAVAFDLQPDVNYTLSIASPVGASASQSTVPAPATLALLSAGLLGMGAASRRRRKT